MFKLLAGIFIFAIMLINSNGGVANELSITIGIALIADGLDTIFHKKWFEPKTKKS